MSRNQRAESSPIDVTGKSDRRDENVDMPLLFHKFLVQSGKSENFLVTTLKSGEELVPGYRGSL